MLILTKASLSDSFDAENQIGHTKYLATRNFNGAHSESEKNCTNTPLSPKPHEPLRVPPYNVKLSVLCDAENCVCLRQISAKFPLHTLISKIKGWIR